MKFLGNLKDLSNAFIILEWKSFIVFKVVELFFLCFLY